MVTVLPRKRPTPIAPPIAIIEICRELRRRCRPSSVVGDEATRAEVTGSAILSRSMIHTSYRQHLPPESSWPDIVRTDPAFQYPDTLNLATVLLDDHVARGHAGRVAIVTGDRRTTYGQLQSLTDRVGRALRRLGVQPGDRVAMRFLNGIPFVATWLAVQKIGAIGVSTMPMLRARELAYIINDSEAVVVACQRDLIDEINRRRPALDHPVAVVDDRDLLGDGPDRLDAEPVGRDDVALIAYTSGSTGVPKGTAHTPADILASADCYGRHVLQSRPDDVFGGHPT